MIDGLLSLLRRVLSGLLPPDAREAVLRDLDEEYRRFARPARGRARATLWYLRQVAGSVGPALVMRVRRARRPRIRSVPRRRADEMHNMLQDLRQTLRFLRSRKGFALAAGAAMALGIGANTAIFSLVDGVLLRPLPYLEPHRLVRIWSLNPRGIPRNSMSPADFFDLRDQTRGFESLAAFTAGDIYTLTAVGEPRRITGTTTTSELFDVLGVAPWLGRPLSAGDAQPERPTAVVISHRLWNQLRSYSGDQAVIGGPLNLDGLLRTIVGVMPADFAFPSPDVDVWVPLTNSSRALSRSARLLEAVGRLSPATTIERGRDELRAIARRLEEQYDVDRGWGITVAELRESMVGEVRRPLAVMLGGVACVLLIACANVANLLFSRGLGRAREMALRSALGATRARLVRQQLVESTAITLVAGLIGVIVAGWSLDLLRAAGGFDLPRLEDVRLNGRVLLATFLMSLLTGVAIGLLPAWRSAQSEPNAALKGSLRIIAPVGHGARATLIAVQVALTLALTIGAGLLTRSLLHVRNLESGFTADRALLAQVSLSRSRYPPDRWAPFFEGVLEGIRRLPSVEAAGAGGPLPLSGQEGLLRFGILIEGWTPPSGASDRVYLRWVTPDYFLAMGIPLKNGRSFLPTDDANSAPVAIVDESFVRRHLQGDSPLGSRVRSSNDRTWRQVVGVVGAVHQNRLEAAPEPHLYVAARQMPSPTMTFVVRTSGDPLALAGVVREEVRRLDAAQPVYDVRTLNDLVDTSVAARRFNARLLGLFAALAGVLTMVGLYGMMSYVVGESTNEIGVRMALGAGRRGILALLAGRLAVPVGVGAVSGLVLAAAGARVISSLLYGVAPRDPVTFVAATSAMIAAAVVGVLIPARRALSIDPAQSLRAE